MSQGTAYPQNTLQSNRPPTKETNMAKRPEPEMQVANPIDSTTTKARKNAAHAKRELKLTKKGTTVTKTVKTKKAAKLAKPAGAKFTEVTEDFILEGVTPKMVTDHFEKLKVNVVSKGKKTYVFTYAAKGAARADIVKRLNGFVAKQAKSDNVVTFEHVPAKKAPAKSKAAAKK